MTKNNIEDDVDPELLGRMGYISRQRNLSMTSVKNMVIKVGLSQMGESNEYDKVILGFRLLNQRLDILSQPLYECQTYKLGDKFSVSYISLTRMLVSDCVPEIYFLWEEEMMKVLSDIKQLDKGVFGKIKKTLKNYRKLWRIFPPFDVDYQESKKTRYMESIENLALNKIKTEFAKRENDTRI